MSRHFFDLRATHNPNRWFLPLRDGLCVGPPGRTFMFGGVGMAAAISALEQTCGRPVIWATAQYLSYARPPSVVDLDVWIAAQGRHTTQARVNAHVGDKEILTVNAALGARPGADFGQWVQAPVAPPPLECEETERWRRDIEDLHSHIEVRVALGRHGRGFDRQAGVGDGRTVLWIRPRDGGEIDAAMLAIMADHVPSAVGAALGRNAGGNSLDNTIRILDLVPTQWVLCETTIAGMSRGAAHGAMRLFSEDGRLLATASQSMIVRMHDDDQASSNQAESGATVEKPSD